MSLAFVPMSQRGKVPPNQTSIQKVACIAYRLLHSANLWPGVKCGCADVVTGNLRMLLRINIRKLPCLTSAHPQNTDV